eukprot:CAMPEP_0201716906 /NCGR_PEP_ID=MMETSP0593-20130828/2769_1 /ASSEMBLY_ACC=CAM_ASM_000672 /TAXON_ID=267983 /ORGANISM="Skeletonema japonicum, Strain CCMP2506" /LENGTH=549 /DNA_ID=CAMNT_0048206829 /DNA_START=137 /DNA_END=1786 /DNA_ORIENTATION=+
MECSDVTAATAFEDLGENVSHNVLSHFHLAELDSIRQVSKFMESACNTRKEFIHGKLNERKSVEIMGLTSERGKQINGRLAVVTGPINNGRYPLKIQHLTGEIERVSLKAQNINPFLKPEQEAKEKSRLDFINYSSDAKVREGHGRLLDQVLMTLRYAVNVMNGCTFFEGGWESFMRLPRSHQGVMMSNTQVFSLYRVKPSSAGYKVTGDQPILDSTVQSLIDFEDNAINYFGKMAAYEKDGSGGKLIIRNFVRAMESWDTERIFGEFWIARICKSGTVVVQKKGPEFGEPELGNVFLVKGIGSQVGEQVPKSQMPILTRTTFLPLYDMLVYDGLMIMDNRFPMTPALKERIHKHVEKAIREETLIYCGESARKGLWNEDPPEHDTSDSRKAKEEEDEEEAIPYEPTSSQLRLAEKIMKFAKDKKYQGRKEGQAVLVVRKIDFSKEENPNNIVGMNWLYPNQSFNGYDMDYFFFKKWPGYTLDELLPELLKKLKKMNEIPGLFWICEKSLVKPLKDTLKAAGGKLAYNETLHVEWYPPPSAEEEAYHSM